MNKSIEVSSSMSLYVFFSRKQMEEMRKFHKCETLLDFAALVLSSGLEERMKLLSSYYESREPEVTKALQSEVFSVSKEDNFGRSTHQTRKRKSTTENGRQFVCQLVFMNKM